MTSFFLTILKIMVLFIIMMPVFFIPFLAFFISTNMLIFGDVSARSLELAPLALLGMILINGFRFLKNQSIRETPLAIFATINPSSKHPVRTLMSCAHSTFLWIVLIVAMLGSNLLNHPLMDVMFFYQSILFFALITAMIVRGVPKTTC